MFSKDQPHSNDKSSSGKRALQPKERSEIPQDQLMDLNSAVQKAGMMPQLLDPRGVLQLQRTIGNRAVSQLLAPTAQHQPTQVLPVQRMKYSTAIHTKFEGQMTNMSCWAACVAAVKGISQQNVINRYINQQYAIKGLPIYKDWDVLVNDFDLMKVKPWKDAVTPTSLVAMIALPDHWVVSYGLTIDDNTSEMTHISFWDPWDGKVYNEDLTTFESKWQPSIAFKNLSKN